MKGRGEGWVAAQALLFLVYLVAPPLFQWPWPLRLLGAVVGIPLLLIGAIFAGFGVTTLGRALSPFPKPKDDGVLITEGIYGCVRHPIYGGLTMAAVGFALLTGSLGRLAAALLLFAFFAAKSEVEERWLRARYPAYAAYRARVRRMLPGLW
ncbi:MAG: isoprenylcysteine carboxylmethyltransferase family protein [Chloroflexota bacterium]|nr:isoprenylcysteine carboxylmethyltransferase family protein [Dehalococcoidia bacterium]MDW8253318.1 isoprenylcysteine carboxylmethyltransferase family protein [Chloroflexota bacterium]